MNSTTRGLSLTGRARAYAVDAARAFEHAPVEVSLSVLLAIAFSYAVASDAEPITEWFELAVPITITGGIAFVATLLHALGTWSARTRRVVTIAGAAAAALYGYFMVDFELAAHAWRAAALVAATALYVIGAPGIGAGSEQFRTVTGRLLLRIAGALLYAGALYAGLALALGAVDTLFELDLDARIYAHVFGWIFFVLVTWVVVGGVPDYVRSTALTPADTRNVLLRWATYLVAPLLAIYYIILYAYAARIAITGELPKNIVSPLVIAAGVIAGIAVVLLDTGVEQRRSLRSVRVVAPLFIPLAALGSAAIVLRLDQYGWTEFRGLRLVLLVTFALMAMGVIVQMVRRRPLPLHFLPLGLAAVLALSVLGPWSVIAVSRRSQQARLAAALAEAGLDWTATAVRDSVIDGGPYDRIRDTSRYLATHHGADALPPLFAQQLVRHGRYTDVVHEAGLRRSTPSPSVPRGGFAQLAPGAVLDVEDDATLHYVRLEMPPRGSDVATDSTLVVPIRIGGTVLHADLSGFTDDVARNQLSPERARVALVDSAGTTRGDLFVLEIGISSDPEPRVFRLVGVARVRTP